LHRIAHADIAEVGMGALAWSPQANEIAFVSASGGIDAASACGGSIRTILSESSATPQPGFAAGTEIVGGVTWAPGQTLLFSEVNSSGTPPSGNIEQVEPDGTGVLTVLSGGYASPSWDPEGLRFLAVEVKDHRIVIATVANGEQSTIGPNDVTAAQWGGPSIQTLPAPPGPWFRAVLWRTRHLPGRNEGGVRRRGRPDRRQHRWLRGARSL
jgi:hypothetical protein